MIRKIINYVNDSKFKIIYFNNSINIVNYDQLLAIKDHEVSIKKENNIILIKGKDLKINKLLDNEVLVTGFIKKIEL